MMVLLVKVRLYLLYYIKKGVCFSLGWCYTMGSDVFMNLLVSILYFFLNPLFIIALIVALVVGYFRVKKERKSFRVRILPGITELTKILSESWVHAIILSVLISGVGLVVDIGWLVLLCAVSIIFILTLNFKLTSPIYYALIAFLGLFLIHYFWPSFEYRGWQVSQVDFLGPLTVTIPVVAGLLLIAEGCLIYKYGGRHTSTYLIETKRGLKAGVFKAKKLWLLPILFLVPGDMIGAYLPYWPQFTLGESAFTFIPVPIVIGFSQVIRSKFPNVLAPQIGRAVIVTGIIVTAVGGAAVWMPILGVTALIAGAVARLGISIAVSIRERNGQFVLAPQSKGLTIVGILPDSPSEKMGLLPGEAIQSINGQAVKNEKELYRAIQLNAAHCRLQIIDRAGEVRLLQQVLYHHDHYRLGLLVVVQ